MKIFTRKIAIAAAVASVPTVVKTRYKLPVPIIRRLRFFGPVGDVGVRLSTTKRLLAPIAEGDDWLRGCGALIDLDIDETIDGSPYEIEIEARNAEASIQTVYLYLEITDVRDSPVHLLHELLRRLQRVAGDGKGVPMMEAEERQMEEPG